MHVVFDFLPVLPGEVFLQFGEAAFRGADEIPHGWVGPAHFFKHGFGRDAAIHDPGALLLSITSGDFLHHATQGGFVGSIAAHHFVADGQAVGGDDQRDDDLHAVGPFVANVAKGFELARLGGRTAGIVFEVGACQVVEQDVVTGAEETGSAILEMGEEVLPMF